MKMDFQNYLMQINVKRREALILYYYNEMSVREIAKICSCFEGTVKSRLHKGRLELREKINATESEYNCNERKALNNA